MGREAHRLKQMNQQIHQTRDALAIEEIVVQKIAARRKLAQGCNRDVDCCLEVKKIHASDTLHL